MMSAFEERRMRPLQIWFLASRPWSFTMSAISVTVGAALAAGAAPFSWGLYLLVLIGIVAFHAATNLINDYFDYRSGVDSPEAPTARYRPHPLVEGLLTDRQVLWESLLFYTLTAGIGLYLAATRGLMVLLLGLIGMAASLFYTAPPLKYKYCALGELSVFAMWGPLMVEGAYFVQGGHLSWRAFWVSLPIGVLVALVLLANNLRDTSYDRHQALRTLPILLGQRASLWLYASLILLAYSSVILMIPAGWLSPWALLVLLSLPPAYRLLRMMARAVPADADARTAQLNTAFGLLLVVALLLERLL